MSVAKEAVHANRFWGFQRHGHATAAWVQVPSSPLDTSRKEAEEKMSKASGTGDGAWHHKRTETA